MLQVKCLTRNKFLYGICAILLFSSGKTWAQQTNETWTLEETIQYALDHNLTIKTTEINERLARLNYQQMVYSQIPNLNGSANYGHSFGRSVDPTTNQFTRGGYDFLSVSANSDVLLFGWFQKRHAIKANRLEWQASREDYLQMQDDIALNVATGFLRAVLANEQIQVNLKQVELSKAQLLQTKQLVKAGSLPELNLAQLEAQLASDSAKYINATADYNAAILDLKALLNLSFDQPLLLDVPDIDVSDNIRLSDLDPEQVYALALQHFGSVKSADLRVLSSEHNMKSAWGMLWPQLALGAQLGSNWASTLKKIGNVKITGSEATPGFVDVENNRYIVYQPTYSISYLNVPLGEQLDQNFRQTISLNLSIPLFNSWSAMRNYKQSKLQWERQEINKLQANIKLKQDIYKAFTDASNAIQKYHAAKRATEAASRAYAFAEKRYQLGLTNTIEYLTTQNNQYQAEINQTTARYDLIFKLKVLDYYQGKPLKM